MLERSADNQRQGKMSIKSDAADAQRPPIFDGQLGWALSNALFVAKAHEAQALEVTKRLRDIFPGRLLWALPYAQINREHIGYPCLRVVDGQQPETPFESDLVLAAQQILPAVYGNQEVYVTTESRTITPEKGDSLKYIVDHALALRYGHKEYMVEFDRSRARSKTATLAVYDFGNTDYFQMVPESVVACAFKLAKEFRPDLNFRLDTSETLQTQALPRYENGFKP
jgi:hypothetical protein